MRGSIQDLAAILGLLFGMGITIYIVIMVMNGFTTGWVAAGHDPTPLNQAHAAYGLFDGAMVLVLTFLIAIIVIGAFYVYAHPIFLVPYIMGLLVLMLVVPQFSNIWTIFSSNAAFAEINSMFPIFNKIMDNLPTLILMIGILVGAVLYGKPQSRTL